ncbi:MAG: hypothetical protein AB7O67_22705 [Vicinamibacterales bacterium]
MRAWFRNIACDLPRALVATVAGGLAGFLISTLSSPRVMMALVGKLTGAGDGAGAVGVGVAATPFEAVEAAAIALALVLVYGAPLYRWLARRDRANALTAALLGAAPGVVLTWWFGGNLLGAAVVNAFVIHGICIALAYHLLATR